ncbi:MAG: type II toxin-antitoxin system VapC family toxin [Chloroflexi bacterium]|nr:type II toxin-antitoxin system VapC family toxin [Chloroflexota bacterium]
MGSLDLPDAGLIYIDASTLIYSVERVEPYRELLVPMWEQAEAGNLTIVSSPILVIETLVKPLQDGNSEIADQYRSIFASNAVNLLETSYAVAELAAQVRADAGLKTPDALHAASALHAGCERFITNDTAFRRVQNLPVITLRDLLEQHSPS